MINPCSTQKDAVFAEKYLFLKTLKKPHQTSKYVKERMHAIKHQYKNCGDLLCLGYKVFYKHDLYR